MEAPLVAMRRPTTALFAAATVVSVAVAACGGRAASDDLIAPSGDPGGLGSGSGVGPFGGEVGGGSGGAMADDSLGPKPVPGGEVPSADAGGGVDASLPPPPAADAGARRDASSTDAAPLNCDVDNDGFLAAACGGNDCCDQDSDVFPGQTRWFVRASRCGRYDYDCDGRSTRRWPEVSCRSVGTACQGEGMMGQVPCGNEGLWQVCRPSSFGGTCEPAVGNGDTREQECR